MARVKWNNGPAIKILSEAEQALIKIGFQIEGDIKRSFATGTGRTYMKGKNKDIVHIASAPGEPPAVDTGRLRASISTNWTGSGMKNGKTEGSAQEGDGVGQPSYLLNKILSLPGIKSLNIPLQFKVVVGTRVKYAVWLEFGTSRMAARPYFRQTVEKYRSMVPGLIVRK